MAIYVTGCKLVYCSSNGTSDTNIVGYWSSPLVGPDGGAIQSDIWQLGAATANIKLSSHSSSSVIKGLQACVQHPFALLAGSINISKNRTIFDISCSNCNLTSCMDNYINGSLLIVKQSPYILVPTNFMGPWYHDRGLQVVKEIKTLSVREKRFVGFVIRGIIAIATMATGAVVLSQSIQNVHYVITLTQNVSYAFQQQVAIDEKIDICLNSLEAALVAMVDEVQMLKCCQDLLCHAGFQHICVTAAPTMPWTSHGNSLEHMSWGLGKITTVPLTYNT
jgi:hypothetical protein